MLWLTLLGRLQAINTAITAILAALGAGAYAVIRSATNNSVTGTTYATMTGFTSQGASGFALASNVLTCTAPGVYELSMNFVFSTGPAGGTLAFRINGGTEVVAFYDISNAIIAHRNLVVRVVLANNDTIDFRIKANNAGENMNVQGSTHTGVIQFSLVRVST